MFKKQEYESLDVFKHVHINIPLLEVVKQLPM